LSVSSTRGTFSMCNAAKADAKVKALVDEHMYSYSDQYGADIMAGDARVLMIGSGLNHPEGAHPVVRVQSCIFLEGFPCVPSYLQNLVDILRVFIYSHCRE